MTANPALTEALRRRLEAEADPERAPGQQRYMKSALPYFGVTTPRGRAVATEVFATHPLDSYEDWGDTIVALMRTATHRDFWSAAVELARYQRYREYAGRMASLDLYETLIRECAWWDIVDEVAAHLVGGLFEVDASWLSARMREWSTDEHLWVRRTSILCQLRRRSDVDLALLYDCIAPNLDERDFFIRKAIGWALREVAKTRPHEVAQYVEAHRDALSGLSKREALKNLLKTGVVTSVP